MRRASSGREVGSGLQFGVVQVLVEQGSRRSVSGSWFNRDAKVLYEVRLGGQLGFDEVFNEEGYSCWYYTGSQVWDCSLYDMLPLTGWVRMR